MLLQFDVIVQWGIMLLSVALLASVLRRGNFRKAAVAFLAYQTLSWGIDFLIVLFKLAEYPVHFFSRATDNGFEFSYLFSPAAFTVFYMTYPHKRERSRKWMHYAIFAVTMGLFKSMLSRYTNTVEFLSTNALTVTLIVGLEYALVYRYVNWFNGKIEALRS